MTEVTYSAEAVEAMLARGESRSVPMSRAEALRRRRADPEAPRPYPGREATVVPGLPEPKTAVTLLLDESMLRWFEANGRDYRALIDAALRGYYERERDKAPEQP